MNRRELITRIGAAAAAAGAISAEPINLLAAIQAQDPKQGGSGKLGRISVSTWSLHNYFKTTRDDDFKGTGSMLELLDFPQMVADKYRVHHIEICAPHFDSTSAGYLSDLKARLAKAHIRVVNMPVDIPELGDKGGLSDTDAAVRDKAVMASEKWIDVAAVIGSKSVRCDPGKLDPKNLAPTVDSYKKLSAYGKAKGIPVIIENHGGVGSEHPEELVNLFKQVGGEHVGALPDFNNFPDEPTREKGLKLLFPYARVVCHAKGMEFDADGNEKLFNFPKCIEISKAMGYQGIYSIEFEGPGDPYVGVQKTLNELLKYL
jgi:sugar phosphate isomerase/epimerase